MCTPAAQALLNGLEKLGATDLHPVKGAALYQYFQLVAAHVLRGNAVAEVLQAFVGAVGIAFLHNHFHRIGAHALNGGQTESHGEVPVRHGFRLEFNGRVVHAGAQHLDTQTSGLLNEHTDFFVGGFIGHEPAEEFHREVGLQVGGPIGNVAVAGGV